MLLEADRAAGPVAMQANGIGDGKARQAGAESVSCAAQRTLARSATTRTWRPAAGMAAIAFSSSTANMAYHGARRGRLDSAARAGGAREDGPIALDMASSMVSMGKAQAGEAHRRPLPPGSALDSKGLETTDPTPRRSAAARRRQGLGLSP